MTGEREMQISFGGLVADYRKRRGMSQTEVAKKVGISRNYVSMIERNEADNLSVGIFLALADVLGTSVYHLLEAYTRQIQPQKGA